ncbi:MAG: hypothetical protein FJ387_07655 [Verrucomicrobia bacterium]|nr:hypothetical protein [Verrucomicrobiota bacterium]
MNRVFKSVWFAGLSALVLAGSVNVMAQRPDRGQGGGDRQGRPNFDPAQMQERMMDRFKETLEVQSEDEWKVIGPRVTKVMEARRDSGFGGAMGMIGMFGRGGPGGQGGPGGPGGGGDQGGGRRFGQQSDPDAEALQRAVESKASNAELKATMAKFIESRKAKQAALDAAQEDLLKVLSVRQEAIARLRGIVTH